MSEEMAVTDKGSGEEAKLNGDEAAKRSTIDSTETSSNPSSQTSQDPADDTASQPTDAIDTAGEGRARKRSASTAFNEDGNEDFKGFDQSNLDNSTAEYSKILERMEAEVSKASEKLVVVRNIIATPTATSRVSKRLRQDTGTDGSRPSSALSSRSDGDGAASSTDRKGPVSYVGPLLVVASSAASSPAHRGNRRATVEMSSPLLRVPLEKGWKRELVYRAALDVHSRRNADIYYYTPKGKKLRSTREIGENLSGTGLTLENFSFFKEPLGVDDPEKEIIRDAKMIRKMESPMSTPPPAPAEGKRTPKPKPPKGASPEPVIKSPPAKIKVKSVGSRLSSGAGSANANTTPKQPAKKQPGPAANSTDNNNTTAWKKPRLGARAHHAAASPASLATLASPASPTTPTTTASRALSTASTEPAAVRPVAPHSQRPRPAAGPDEAILQSPPQVQQPCSISCGGGMVPSLACSLCLCLYHPPCVGHKGTDHAADFLCKNCKKCTSPPLEAPSLVHKSGAGNVVTSRGRRTSQPRQRQRPAHHPVTLTMKVSGSDAGGQRMWSVKPPPTAASRARALAQRSTMPMSLANINGKRFIVVPRNIVAPTQPETKRTRVNGTPVPPPPPVAPPAAPSPRGRRARGKTEDTTDYFTQFYNKSKSKNYIVVSQIFQYLGMRDLAHCARVCRLWRELAATPLLWRHVRMKNSHVSSWSGLCSALKRHGTTRLDLRKMLLPQNDTAFWEAFAQHIPTVDTLERIEMCRCPASAVEAVCSGLTSLRSLSALAIRDGRLDPWPLAELTHLQELRLKSMAGLSLTRDLAPLAKLTNLQHLSLTSIKELGLCSCEIVGSLKQLISLELGECTFRASFGSVLGGLQRLQRLRLERGTAECAAPQLLRALADLPRLRHLELVNFDVKVGFDDALAECRNIQRLLIIPTYVSQSATTNKQVLSGVLRLKDTLTHLMWGVTIELLRVTELFIDQCDQGGDSKKKDIGECIPVLKPVPGCKLPEEHHHVAGPPQVEILPLPTLQRLLSAQLPNTKLKLLRIPFHATWRQSLADFQ